MTYTTNENIKQPALSELTEGVDYLNVTVKYYGSYKNKEEAEQWKVFLYHSHYKNQGVVVSFHPTYQKKQFETNTSHIKHPARTYGLCSYCLSTLEEMNGEHGLLLERSYGEQYAVEVDEIARIVDFAKKFNGRVLSNYLTDGTLMEAR